MTTLKTISGKELKLILKRKRILQSHLVEEFGMNKSTLSRYFSDSMQMPAAFILKVAHYAKLELKDLVKEEKRPILYAIGEESISMAAEPTEKYTTPSIEDKIKEIDNKMDNLLEARKKLEDKKGPKEE